MNITIYGWTTRSVGNQTDLHAARSEAGRNGLYADSTHRSKRLHFIKVSLDVHPVPLASCNPESARVEKGVVEVEDDCIKPHGSTVSVAGGASRGTTNLGLSGGLDRLLTSVLIPLVVGPSKRTFRNLDQGDRACASAVPGSRL